MTTYTDSQTAAIDCVGRPLQIIACAGSGKTQVISQRIANLLSSGLAEPRNIVAFTFTDKSAGELKDRVIRLIGASGGSTVGLAEMFIGTMHGYCLDVLQRHVPETFKFGVLTEITSRMLVDRYARQSGLVTCPTSLGRSLKRFVDSQLYLQVMAVLREDDVDQGLVPDGVLESYVSYLRLLGKRAYFDYTSMILLAVEMLEAKPEDDALAVALLDHVSFDLKYLVVDEYQDVNPLQERLINALTQFGANLCVVGDDDQTIYQWRGSEVRNIVGFSDRHAGVEQITLADNFRSTKGIVDLGRSVAELIPATERLAKQMVAAGHQAWQRGDILALEFEDEAAEASWICDRVQACRGLAFVDVPSAPPRGLSWSDCAVLYRSVAGDAGPLVAEMRKRDIPYVIKGLNRLFESPEIQAVALIFAYMTDRTDSADLREAWDQANLVPPQADWSRALGVLARGRDFGQGSRWGLYNIQRIYLDFLEALGIREDTLPGDPVRRELVFYQLGKFSQAISDFEEIHFASSPGEKYLSFANWLQYQAPQYYADADADVGYAAPDAVTISTVHQAKGMQWPVVFMPCLRRNRFPAKRIGGTNVFHVVPSEAVHDPDRYRGTVQDEERLFYVAVTRSQKWLYLTFSPRESKLYRKRSQLFDHCTRQSVVSTHDPGVDADAPRLTPAARVEAPQITLSFSELKYYFECPYQFKMRYLYGFNAPIHEALGYGKGLHDALAEVHKRAIEGELMAATDAPALVEQHLNTPYAYPELRRQLEKAAIDAIERYLRDHGAELPNTVHSEKPIQVHLGDGIVVDGRIDLIRRLDTDELSIVDFKSTERAQEENVTRDQLHIYALGYEELSGERADLIEVLNLDEKSKSVREEVDGDLISSVRTRITDAGTALRSNDLKPHPQWCRACESCDFVAMCPTGQART